MNQQMAIRNNVSIKTAVHWLCFFFCCLLRKYFFGHLCGHNIHVQKQEWELGNNSDCAFRNLCTDKKKKKARQTLWAVNVDIRAYAWKPGNKKEREQKRHKRERARLFTTLSQRVALNVLSPFFQLISQAQKCRSEQSMLVRHPSSGEERHCW